MAASRPPIPLRTLILVSVTMILSVWLNSGTLAPFAASLPSPTVDAECGYLHNWDLHHHLGPHQMLDRQDRTLWEDSATLRRILYNLAAYPFIKSFGLAWGGVITNSLLLIGVSFLFGAFVRVRVGTRAAVSAMWLIATYPGIAYYGGLPYSYATIVLVMLVGYMLLYRINEAEHLGAACGFALVFGLLLLAYDFFPFFAPAAALLLLRKKTWWWIPFVVLLMLGPSIGFILFLKYVHGINPFNEIGAQYPAIIGSYFHPGELKTWFWYIKQSPLVFLHNFFFSNFLFIPLAFVAALFLRWREAKRPSLTGLFHRVDAALALSLLAVFLFNNLAPSYEGWQMRGVWIARLYQPLLLIMVMVLARTVQAQRGKDGLVVALPILALGANLTICFSGIAHLPHGEWFYWQFYRHTPESHYNANLETYGRRPVGFCVKDR